MCMFFKALSTYVALVRVVNWGPRLDERHVLLPNYNVAVF